MCSTFRDAHTVTTKQSLLSLAKQPGEKKEDGLCSWDGGLRLNSHGTGKTGPTHLLKIKIDLQECSFCLIAQKTCI